MILLLDAITSLGIYRRFYPPHHCPSPLSRLPRRQTLACNIKDISKMIPNWIDDEFIQMIGGRIGYCTTEDAQRRKSGRHTARCLEKRPASKSFANLTEEVFICSPEYVFLEMAAKLKIEHLIALGDELCGFYCLDATSSRGMRQRQIPLTNMRKLTSYLEKCAGTTGIKKARRALKYLVDASASPAETSDEMQLCLPRMLGGCALPKPAMNLEIPLTAKAQKIAGQKTCYGDLCWSDDMTIVEHQSLDYHTAPISYNHDRARINALKAMGYTVFELTSGQMSNDEKVLELARAIAKCLKRRSEENAFGSPIKRIALRNSLKLWNKSYGFPPYLCGHHQKR